MEDQDNKFDSEDSISYGSIKSNIEERLDEPIDALENERDAVFRMETEESASGEVKTKTQDDATLEANTEGSEQEEILLTAPDVSKDKPKSPKKHFQETIKRFVTEMAAGNTADLVGQNQHIEQDDLYNDLGRRFVPQYKYNGVLTADHYDDLTPEKAPPELVLVVAKESALLGPDKDMDPGNDVDRKKILRSGEYWNGVWKEEVKFKEDVDVTSNNALRSATQNKVLGSIKAKIKPGSEFYKVVSRMKKISPRLLYIINKKQL